MCPRVVQRWSVCESLSECVSKKVRQTHTFLRSTLLEQTGPTISNRLSEMKQSLSVSLAESIIEQVLQDLTATQEKMDGLIKENSCIVQKIIIPELQLVESDFPTDDYSPAVWRSTLRPASSIKSETKTLLPCSPIISLNSSLSVWKNVHTGVSCV